MKSSFCTHFDLACRSYECEILAFLAMEGQTDVQRHTFLVKEINKLVEFQPQGKTGMLLTNGFANIFFVLVGEETQILRIHWSMNTGEWCRRQFAFKEFGRWDKGTRVFRK